MCIGPTFNDRPGNDHALIELPGLWCMVLEASDIIKIILSILIPPLGVFLEVGLRGQLAERAADDPTQGTFLGALKR